MKFAESLENFTSPVIAVDSEMFVAAKNYLASMTFPNIHVGAKIEKYTDIDLSKEPNDIPTLESEEETHNVE